MTMAAWERDDEAVGHSVARWEELADGYLFHGTEVLVDQTAVLSCSFSVRLDRDWVTRSVAVSAVSSSGAREHSLMADDDRLWTVDGAHRPDLDGCIDVDVAATPLTNTFPVRRLAALPVGEAVTTAIAWIDVPSLEVHRVDQTYERLPDRDGLAVWRYSDPTHGAFVLTVDEDGLVIDYEGFARRLRLQPR